MQGSRKASGVVALPAASGACLRFMQIRLFGMAKSSVGQHIVREQLMGRKVMVDQAELLGDGDRVLPAALALPTGATRSFVITLEIREGVVENLRFARRIALRHSLGHATPTRPRTLC